MSAPPPFVRGLPQRAEAFRQMRHRCERDGLADVTITERYDGKNMVELIARAGRRSRRGLGYEWSAEQKYRAQWKIEHGDD